MLQAPPRRAAINNGKNYCCFVSRMHQKFIKHHRKTKTAKGTKLLLRMDKKWLLYLSLLPFFLPFTGYNKWACFRGIVLPALKFSHEFTRIGTDKQRLSMPPSIPHKKRIHQNSPPGRGVGVGFSWRMRSYHFAVAIVTITPTRKHA